MPQAELIKGSDGKLYGTTVAGGSVRQGTLYRVNQDGTGFVVIKSFGSVTNDGQRPSAAVIEATDGFLYGTTGEGGNFGLGTVFRSDMAGSNFSVLASFDGTNGAYPEARLLEASDGLLYGTTSGGGPGTNDYGVVFRLHKDGTGFEVLKTFAGNDGANPEGGLLEATDGGLYGTTLFGGGTNIPGWTSTISSNVGTLFRLEKDGSGFSVLHHFYRYPSGSVPVLVQTNGYFPYGEVVQGTNGFLYGTTSAGGRQNSGTVYRINTNGADFAVLRELTNSTGAISLSGLALATDGRLYGTTFDGGTNGGGVVFRIDQDGSNYLTLTNIVLGQGAAAGLVESTDGDLIGTTKLGGVAGEGTIFRIQKNGAGFTVLRQFSAAGGDGESPYAGLLHASDGLYYGTTRLGSEQGAGCVFQIDALGRAYQITAALPVGANPTASVIESANGVFVGAGINDGTGGHGAIFSLNPTGPDLTTLHDFAPGVDGYYASAALTRATNGYLYGITAQGGTGFRGILFRLTPDGSNYTVLHQFDPGGLNPMQPLLQASDGRLYGTTYVSYLNTTYSNAANGCIFRIDLDGTNYTLVKTFDNRLTTGANPMSPLLEGNDGMLYGTTYSGGTTNDAGVVYRVNKDGSGFQLLHAFLGVAGDGRHPCGSLVEAADGTLYGTTERGGASGQGTLFQLNKDGSGYAVLASFDASTGAYPRGGLTSGPKGALYGTTDQGGPSDAGTIFRFGDPLEYIAQVTLASGQIQLACVGAPGTNYLIERTTTLGSSAIWEAVQSTNAPASGQFFIADQPPSGSSAFYRMRH